MDSLQHLLARLNGEITAVENHISGLEEKLRGLRVQANGVQMTIALLSEECPLLPMTVPATGSNRFAGMDLMPAVLECYRAFSTERGLTRAEAKTLLLQHGYKNNSKDIYASVSITVTRLHAKGLLEELQGDGPKRHRPSKIISSEKAA